ncbi:hypothetical protein HMPREF1582_01481 [Gardnerella vaginalis JCP8151A]|nr:hypothetical protein HMPREF1582_01481 [Gardnerella vaginalis JCP8151A]
MLLYKVSNKKGGDMHVVEILVAIASLLVGIAKIIEAIAKLIKELKRNK